MSTGACYLRSMHKLIIVAVLIAAAGPAGAETVVATPQMNRKIDGVTPGVTPVGALSPNRAEPMKCQVIAGNFRYPDGSVKRETMTRCE
jgi:hypothetical protein